MKKGILIALLIFTFAGFVASLLMTQLHYKMSKRGLEERSFCHVSEFFDCDTALASRYSHLDTGIPKIGRLMTSELGLIYYTLVMMGVLYAFFSAQGKSSLSFLLTSSVFAVLDSVILAYISLTKLGVVCLLCLTTYITNIALLFLLPNAMGLSYGQVIPFVLKYMGAFLGLARQEMPPRRLFHGIVTIVLLVGGIFFFKGLNPSLHAFQPKIPKDRYLAAYYALPQSSIDISGKPVWGNKDASVTVVEFSDFQCPFCRLAAFNLKPVLKEYREKVRFVFMNYPLDNACNPAIERAMHPVACLAAKAALCSERQGKFWDYHDLVFENQKKLSREKLLSLAEDAKMNRARFEQCLVADDTSEALKKEVGQGGTLQIRGTPSVFINGRSFRDWPHADRLRMVIEAEIAGYRPPPLPLLQTQTQPTTQP